MSSKFFALVAFSSFGLTACFQAQISSMGSVQRIGPASNATINNAATTEVKSVSTVDANSTENVQLTAPAVEGLSGATVTIPPGSLSISVDLVVEQAADLSDTSMASEMGLADTIQISAATPGMIIRPSENVDLKKPLSLSMPLPVGLGFHLASGSKYAIFYKYFDPTEQKLVTGMKVMDGTNVKLVFDEKLGKDTLAFEGYFGAYWAAILSRDVTVEEVPPPKPAEEPIMNKAKVPVIANSGMMKETDVVKMQIIPELVWDKPSVKFISDARQISVAAVVPQGQKVEGCKADFYEDPNNKTGLSFEAPEGPKFLYTIVEKRAHNLVGRFRCRDVQGRVSVTPWSDAVAIPALAASLPSSSVPTGPGVEVVNGDTITISGSLKPIHSLLLFTLATKEGKPGVREIPVDAAGNFSFSIDRSNTLALRLQSKINASPINRDSAFFQDLSTFFGVSLAEANSHLASMTDADVRSDMLSEIEDQIQNGNRSLLVAYDKTPASLITEAQSFKFIGFPTPSGNTIFAFSPQKLRGNVRLGDIVTNNNTDEVQVAVPALALVAESDAALEGMARFSRSVKSIRNAHINDSWRATAYSQWKSQTTLANAVFAYTSPALYDYKGYGFYTHNDTDPGFDLASICGSSPTSLQWLAPAPIPVISGGTTTNVTAINNSGSSPSTDPMSNPICTGEQFYARSDSNGLNLQFGSGTGIQGTIPTGLWQMSYDGVIKANYEFGGFKVLDTNNQPLVIIPSISVSSSGSNYLGADIKFWIVNGGTPVQMTDLNLVRRLIQNATFSMWGSGSEYRADVVWTAGVDYATATLATPAYSANVNSAAFEYRIGDYSFRFELNNAL